MASFHCNSSTPEVKCARARVRGRMQQNHTLLHFLNMKKKKTNHLWWAYYFLLLRYFFSLISHNNFSKHLIACALVLCGSCSEAWYSVPLINMWLLLPKSQDLFHSSWCVYSVLCMWNATALFFSFVIIYLTFDLSSPIKSQFMLSQMFYSSVCCFLWQKDAKLWQLNGEVEAIIQTKVCLKGCIVNKSKRIHHY